MVQFGDITRQLLHYSQAVNNPEQKAFIMRQVNSDYRSLAAKESWGDMRKMLAVTWDGDPVQLPSDLQGIDLVWDDTNYLHFLERKFADSEFPESAFRFYTYPVGTSLVEVADAAFAQDNTTMSSVALDASGETVVGEYFFIEGSSQMYEITATTGTQFTISPGYRGLGSASSQKITVRPRNTLMLQLIGPDGTQLPTTEVNLHYWQMPDVLRDPDDLVLLPTSEVLLTLTLTHLPGSKKLRPVSQNEVQREYATALQLNPDKPKPKLVKGLNGRPLNMGTGMYKGRGGDYSPHYDRTRCLWQMNRS